MNVRTLTTKLLFAMPFVYGMGVLRRFPSFVTFICSSNDVGYVTLWRYQDKNSYALVSSGFIFEKWFENNEIQQTIRW